MYQKKYKEVKDNIPSLALVYGDNQSFAVQRGACFGLVFEKEKFLNRLGTLIEKNHFLHNLKTYLNGLELGKYSFEMYKTAVISNKTINLPDLNIKNIYDLHKIAKELEILELLELQSFKTPWQSLNKIQKIALILILYIKNPNFNLIILDKLADNFSESEIKIVKEVVKKYKDSQTTIIFTGFEVARMKKVCKDYQVL